MAFLIFIGMLFLMAGVAVAMLFLGDFILKRIKIPRRENV